MVTSIPHASEVALLFLALFGQVEPKPERETGLGIAPRSVRATGAPASKNLPAAFAADIKVADDAYRSVRVNQSVWQWQFGTTRARYESLLKRANGDHAVEEVVRARLARLASDERSAEAARTIESILAASHRRDREVAAAERQVAGAARSHARAFNARGYVQASSAMIDGRKLYILIANDGSTIAYLDVPPGLDIDPLLAHRVGVRGEPHFNEDLGARLITVRDVENLSR